MVFIVLHIINNYPHSRGGNTVFTSSFKGRQYCFHLLQGETILFTSSFKGRQYYFHLLLRGETILFWPPPSRGVNTDIISSIKGRQYCFHLLFQGETILFSPPSRGDNTVFILIIHHEKFHTKLLHVISANHHWSCEFKSRSGRCTLCNIMW